MTIPSVHYKGSVTWQDRFGRVCVYDRQTGREFFEVALPSPEVDEAAVTRLDLIGLRGLTDYQREVLEDIMRGFTPADIARKNGRDPSGIRHLLQVVRRLARQQKFPQ